MSGNANRGDNGKSLIKINKETRWQELNTYFDGLKINRFANFYTDYSNWRDHNKTQPISDFYATGNPGEKYSFLDIYCDKSEENSYLIKKIDSLPIDSLSKNSKKQFLDNVTRLVEGESFLDAITTKGKVQLLYLFGRKGYNTSTKACDVLAGIIEKCEDLYDSEKSKDRGIVLRAAYVAGVNQGLEDKSKQLFRRLLWDKNFREGNSDFHLGYWTDNNRTDNDKADEVVIAVNELSAALIENNEVKNCSSRSEKMRWLFQLFTSCTIWQDVWTKYKKVATDGRDNTGLAVGFDKLKQNEKEAIRTKVKETVKISVDYVLNYPAEFGLDKDKDKDLIEYLKHMKYFCEKRSFNSEVGFFKLLSDSYRSFCRVREAKRRNWLIRGVDSSQCESVAEHIYSAWLLASLFLPEELPEKYKKESSVKEGSKEDYSGYCKKDILSMLLIHDLPKSRTGDHSTYHRDLDKEKEEYSDEMMQEIAFYATFHVDGTDLSEWRMWNQWFDDTTCNAKIAHDINRIQAVFQFLQYRKSGLLKFDENIGFFHWWLCHYDDHYYQSISGIYSMTIERYEAIDGGILAGKSDEIDTNKRIVQSKLQSIKNLKEEIDTIKSVDNKKSGQDTSKDPWLYTALCKELAINVLGNVGNYNAPGAEDDKVFHKMKDLEKHLKDLEEAVEKLKEENEKYEDQQKPPSSKPPKKPKPPKH